MQCTFGSVAYEAVRLFDRLCCGRDDVFKLRLEAGLLSFDFFLRGVLLSLLESLLFLAGPFPEGRWRHGEWLFWWPWVARGFCSGRAALVSRWVFFVGVLFWGFVGVLEQGLPRGVLLFWVV